MTQLILASASPSRRKILQSAGVDPQIVVSNVDEQAVTIGLGPVASPADVVSALASAKAEAAVSQILDNQQRLPIADVGSQGTTDAEGFPGHELDDFVIVACDSMLLVDGELTGKPHTIPKAREQWEALKGKVGKLLTGHTVIRLNQGTIAGSTSGIAETLVDFGTPTETDLEAYLSTREPLETAGAFTLEGRGGWFIDQITGDPSCVVGLSLPLLRTLLAELGISIADIWRHHHPSSEPASSWDGDSSPEPATSQDADTLLAKNVTQNPEDFEGIASLETKIIGRVTPVGDRPRAFKVFDNESTKVVAFEFDTGQRLLEHAAHHPVIIQLLAGRVNFGLPDKTVELVPGQLIHLTPLLRHSVEALEPSTLTVTMLLPRKEEASRRPPKKG